MRINKWSRVTPYLLLLTGGAAVLFWALCSGAVTASPGDVLKILFTPWRVNHTHPDYVIITQVRLPRIVLAWLTGGALSIAGAASQTLFRNPLASPYVIGVSNGAALGAALGLLLAAPLGFYTVPLCSVIAGLMVMVFILYVAGGKTNFSNYLLLTGIALNAFCSALTAIILFMAEERLQGIVFWLMGGLWKTGWEGVWLLLPIVCVALAILIVLTPELNLLLLGERAAAETGVNVLRTQRIIVVVIAVTTAVCISLTGVIGFVGLLVPHIVRLLVGADHRRLLPASLIGGGMFMVGADTLARTMAAPLEIPVGVITSLIGAPFFMWLLLRKL